MRRIRLFGRSATALVVFGVALGLAGSAAAELRPGKDRTELRRQLVELQRRALEIQQEIRRVEAAIEQSNREEVAAARAVAPPADECTLPFYLDNLGIKHLRPDCADAASQASSCDPPYELDARGVRHIREACADSAAEPSSTGRNE